MALATSQPKLLLASAHNFSLKKPTKPGISFFGLPSSYRNTKIALSVSRISVSAQFNGAPRRIPLKGLDKSVAEHFGYVSSSSDEKTSSVGVNPILRVKLAPSLLEPWKLWFLAGVGIGVLMFWSTSILWKRRAPSPSELPWPVESPSPAPQSAVTVDILGKSDSVLSVGALEKMMEDPTAQKMIFLYLPEDMRSPETLKWMLKDPQYRKRLQDMLNTMGGSAERNKKTLESLKNFDLSSPKVKQQFKEFGLPEEVISKILADPDIVLALQNPRIQEAIMECTKNFLCVAKYVNDEEVMDVINKVSQLTTRADNSKDKKSEETGKTENKG